MTTDETPSDNMPKPTPTHSLPPGLVDRVKAILLKPTQEWEKIAGETSDVKSLFTGYVGILAAIPAFATFIGSTLIGVSIFKTPMAMGLTIAVLSYVMSLVSVYVLGLVIDALSTNFGAEKNKMGAFKVAAYCGTATWVAGIAGILPALASLLGLIGFVYSVFLLYRGLGVVMKAPQDKTIVYTLVVGVCMFVFGLVTSLVTVPLVMGASMAGGGGLLSGMTTKSDSTLSGKMSIPGVGEVDAGKLQEAAKSMETAAQAASAGNGIKAVDAQSLEALLPASFQGAARTDLETNSGGTEGYSISTAKATYQLAEGKVTLSITDLGSMGALTGVASALKVNSSKKTDKGYENVTTVDGQMITESYDNAAKRGEYNVVVNTRMAIAAEGTDVSMDTIKAAVAQIDQSRLKALN